jgi:hypothetical protein
MRHQLLASRKVYKWVTEDIFQELLGNDILVRGGATPQSAREVTPLNLPKQSTLKEKGRRE